MKATVLIEKLTEMVLQVGDADVKVYSEDYCCDLHNIEDVTDGYTSNDGWTHHDGVIGICITK